MMTYRKNAYTTTVFSTAIALTLASIIVFGFVYSLGSAWQPASPEKMDQSVRHVGNILARQSLSKTVMPKQSSATSKTAVTKVGVYKWTDGNGQVHFSDQKNLPAEPNRIEPVEIEPNVVEVERVPNNARQYSGKKSVKRKSADVQGGSQKAWSGDSEDAGRCKSAKKKLDNIRSKMRAGYTASEQRRLHDKEIEYMEERSRYCH
jgi:hypothetical protein